VRHEPANRHPALDAQARARILEAVRRAAATEPRVGFAVAYGSFARGEDFADLDVAVSMDEPFGYLDLGMLAARIGEDDSLRGIEVDVVAVEIASPLMRMRIASEGVLAYERQRWAYPSFYSRALVEGADLLESLRRARHPASGASR
jgi:predicted nucleotidyltransferase